MPDPTTMTEPPLDLDAQLAAADPAAGELDDGILAAAAALAGAAAGAARSARRPLRKRLWIPALSLAVLSASTAGAAFATGGFTSWPVHFTIGGETVDTVVEADASVPIEFTTRSGEHISCTWAISYSWGDTAALKRFVSTHDWSDLGQRAYEEHLAHPYYPTSVTTIDDDGTRHELTPEEIKADGPMFTHAIQTVFDEQIPARLRAAEYVSTGDSDCGDDIR